tara:strand:+ start:1149 stop:1772 length:624 start_codon:yes stop_codon:yes gene_type:complete
MTVKDAVIQLQEEMSHTQASGQVKKWEKGIKRASDGSYMIIGGLKGEAEDPDLMKLRSAYDAKAKLANQLRKEIMKTGASPEQEAEYKAKGISSPKYLTGTKDPVKMEKLRKSLNYLKTVYPSIHKRIGSAAGKAETQEVKGLKKKEKASEMVKKAGEKEERAQARSERTKEMKQKMTAFQKKTKDYLSKGMSKVKGISKLKFAKRY